MSNKSINGTNGQEPQGSHRNAGSSSLTGMLSTLVPASGLAVVYLIFFLAFRWRRKHIYQPRTYRAVFLEEEETPKPRDGMVGWIKDFVSLSDHHVLSHHSLDAYLYLRFFKTLVIIAAGGMIITWPTLFPVYAMGGGDHEQFDMFSFGNVRQSNRLYATVFVSWVYLGFVVYLIARESIHLVAVRQAYSLSPFQASRMSTRTVLFTDIPDAYLDEAKIRSVFSGVKHVWMLTNCSHLKKPVEDRDKMAIKLEDTLIDLSRSTNDNYRKISKSSRRPSEGGVQVLEQRNAPQNRPTHRSKPLVGTKLDTIDYYLRELQKLLPRVEQLQIDSAASPDKRLGACFVEFANVQSAQSAFQEQISRLPKRFQARCIGARPDEIIWTNLGKKWATRDMRYGFSSAVILFLIIFWSIPVSFGGFLSNIPRLIEIAPFLDFIYAIPGQYLGVLTGLVPVLWVVLLLLLVPVICRRLAIFSGAVTTAEVELITENWYFGFQVVQVFLVTTFASGASAVISFALTSPTQIPLFLATNLPLASNFYISYFIIFGITMAASDLANPVPVISSLISRKRPGKTPRQRYGRYAKVAGVHWGTVYPKFANLGVICISYSCIAPLVLGFAAVGLYLLYLTVRYNLLYVVDASIVNTQGMAYQRALQHLMVGVYIAEICLIGLFTIWIGYDRAAAGPLVLELVFLIATALFHRYLRSMVGPLLQHLPRDLLSASARGTAVPSQRMSEEDREMHPALGQRDGMIASSNGNLVDEVPPLGGSDPKLTEKVRGRGPKSWFHWFLHPTSVPRFAPFFNRQLPPYSPEIRRTAYLDPLITKEPPILWIVRDQLGISRSESEKTRSVIECTDIGAWWDEKGKLATEFEGKDDVVNDAFAARTPFFEPKVFY
ncbi:DUF221-domain-containing protein [Aulographum hederae CBS 113979]|uniref:DUF221-domain-containing protein n=1 Tax=Aulographum hederae CBS 113979 TaxID=1176131 RepID=A0A6G1GLS4_9PEZI|nr:DUF221-domain-containing protein [Aulographum hederae CBS 113979]